jgi:hypothetical protein
MTISVDNVDIPVRDTLIKAYACMEDRPMCSRDVRHYIALAFDQPVYEAVQTVDPEKIGEAIEPLILSDVCRFRD